jgi:hypothetical protein
MPDGHKFEKQHLGGGSCPRRGYISSTRLPSKVLLALALSIWGGLIADLRGELSSNASVFAVGLDYPRGLTFGPDGNLYVAEAGRGGTNSTVGKCLQDDIVGPFRGGLTARVSRVSLSPTGVVRETFVQGLPSAQGNASIPGFVLGAADVAFLGETPYILIAGGGCAHANRRIPASIARVKPDGTYDVIANLSDFLATHPVAKPPLDFDPDGTWWSLEAAHGNLYALNPNQGDLDRITPQGQISRVLDTSAQYGHIVPTALAYHGNFYLGNLGTFPPKQGSQSIYKVTPGGQSKVVVKGLTMITGMTFDNRNRLYVLQNTAPVSDEDEIFGLGTGVVVRVNPNGSIETIATGLSFPAGITFGPDGALYVSNFGFGFTSELPLNSGQIVRISIPKHRNMQSNEQDDDGHEDDLER